MRPPVRTAEYIKAYKRAYYLAHWQRYADRSRAWRTINHEASLKYARWYKRAKKQLS